MAASKPNQTSSDFEEYIRDLLECPVCMEIIKSVPVYQCANGHVICMDCIEQLHNCPICRNDSELRRSLKLENIVQRLEGIQPENVGPPTGTRNLQKWGKRFVRSYGTINGSNQAAPIGINLQANPEQARRQTRRESRIMINNQEVESARQVITRPITTRAGQAALQRNRARNRGECLCSIIGNFIILLVGMLTLFIVCCLVYFLIFRRSEYL